MPRKFTTLVGTTKQDFDHYIADKQLYVRPARLIPTIKAGDEMALTSVILSAMRMVTEFRKLILKDIDMPKSGNLFVYTEAIFPESEKNRIDGLALVVKNGIIRDAAIFEMKNGTDELEETQICRYIEIAKKFSIPRLVTVSNQFVSEPTQFPLQDIRTPKGLSLYHLSWSYLNTLAHILLFKNDTNIEDDDQVGIMKEVVKYLEDEKSGVTGFNSMKPGWQIIMDKINAGTRITLSDPDLADAASSWQQEEKDMALKLSKELGVFVNSGSSKYRGNLKARLDDDKRNILNTKKLTSALNVKNAVSDISIDGLLEKRTIEMSVSLRAPTGRLKGQVGWLKRQIETCQRKSAEVFIGMKGQILIEVAIKNYKNSERFLLDNIDKIAEELRGKEIREFRIVLVKDIGKSFSNRKKFVSIVEKMLVDYYQAIVQHLKNWDRPAPKIDKTKAPIDDVVVSTTPFSADTTGDENTRFEY